MAKSRRDKSGKLTDTVVNITEPPNEHYINDPIEIKVWVNRKKEGEKVVVYLEHDAASRFLSVLAARLAMSEDFFEPLPKQEQDPDLTSPPLAKRPVRMEFGKVRSQGQAGQ